MGFLSTITQFDPKTIMEFSSKHSKIAIMAIVLLVGFGGYKIKNMFDTIKSENTQLVVKNDRLQKEKEQLILDVATVVKVNSENQLVIEKLSVAKADSVKQVSELVKVKQILQSNNDNLLNFIAKSTPAEDGPIAPVLSDTIKTIQLDRDAAK